MEIISLSASIGIAPTRVYRACRFDRSSYRPATRSTFVSAAPNCTKRISTATTASRSTRTRTNVTAKPGFSALSAQNGTTPSAKFSRTANAWLTCVKPWSQCCRVTRTTTAWLAASRRSWPLRRLRASARNGLRSRRCQAFRARTTGAGHSRWMRKQKMKRSDSASTMV